MNISYFSPIDIDVEVRGIRKQHKVVVYKPTKFVLSYTSIWLGLQKSYNTSFQYAKILCIFLSFLYVHYSGNEDIILEFWAFIDTDTIRAWKTSRLYKRYSNLKNDGNHCISPSNKTIDNDAVVICKFMDWVKYNMHVETRWDGNRKKIDLSFSLENSLLKGIATPKKREVVHAPTNAYFGPNDSNYPIEGLVNNNQNQFDEYLNTLQIKTLINSFSDPVWKYISATVAITGLRPHEVLAIPYYHTYINNVEFMADPDLILDRLKHDRDKNIIFSELKMLVLGKGAKQRSVKINTQDWFYIMESWMPIYNKRKQLYKANTGIDCPSNILWLNKKGEPIYCDPRHKKDHRKTLDKLQSAFYYASNSINKDPLSPLYNRSVNCYCLRHTYATNFIIDLVNSEKIKSASDVLSNIAMQKMLADQMGHTEFDTTLKHYVDTAAVILMTQCGKSVPKFVDIEKILKNEACQP